MNTTTKTKRKARTRITAAERKAIKRMRSQGLTIPAIATETGRAARTISRIVSTGTGQVPVAKADRNAAIVAAAAKGESNASIARRFGISNPRVRQILATAEKHKALALATAAEAALSAPRPAVAKAAPTPVRAERDKLLAADAATMTLAQLGRKYGLKPSSVKTYLHPLGVKAATKAEIDARAPVYIPDFLPPRERTHGTDAIGRKTVTTPAGNVIVLDEVEPATKAPAAPVDLFKAYDLLKSAMPKPVPAADLDDDYLPEPKAPAPVPPAAFLAEIEARHGTAEVLRRHPECDEGELLAALREGRKSVKAPVDDLPQPWLTRAGAAVSRFFGFGRS